MHLQYPHIIHVKQVIQVCFSSPDQPAPQPVYQQSTLRANTWKMPMLATSLNRGQWKKRGQGRAAMPQNKAQRFRILYRMRKTAENESSQPPETRAACARPSSDGGHSMHLVDHCMTLNLESRNHQEPRASPSHPPLHLTTTSLTHHLQQVHLHHCSALLYP